MRTLNRRPSLAFIFAAASSQLGCPSSPGDCTPVPILDAGRVVYQCDDGRQCSDTRENMEGDGGVYQVCPGPDECARLVSYDGTSVIGFC